TPPGAPITECKRQSWSWEVWSRKDDANPIRRFLRREAPYRLFKRLEPFFGASRQPDLVSPHQLSEHSDPLSFQPAEWYKPCWPYMKAFALPSFSEGYIRINLKGREARGLVAPSEYEAFCDQLTQKLYRLTDARTGTPMVKEIIRTRQNPTDSNPKLPDADLVVIWQEEYATDVVDSPDVGRIGPVPHVRTGSHRSEGFIFAQGQGIEPGISLPTSHALDVTPTILSLMGAPIPDYFDGKPLLETAVLAG
ncbi:MAG: nucleotide pyrophosphatase, partial [Coleofasciculus sp. S288]|nr:nucleotide pyrophosphatase [Coleofasciculus sp. S288]